ncbi:integrase catalytic domain-containing protein [Trichonephila clavipes]|nr:integrase catalytic domain-containing protein [Trichonephila clavipes]
MDLKAQKAQRRVLRTAFTLSANKIESELKNDVVDLQKISLLQVQLKDKYLRLEAAHFGTLLHLEDNGEEFETDFTDAESYLEPKSKAERLILSFPATAANHPKAVEQLKERFGREDLLVQIYVRDLLTMVMKNAVSGRAKMDLSRLYDEWEGKLRALESLERTQEKFGDFLAPLVESCLPEEVLMTWERNRNHHELSDNTAGKNVRSLENLMTFLRQEVQGEEMVVLSRTRFASNKVTRKNEYVCTPLNEISGDPATAAALGINLLEVIPEILDRFGLYPIGLSADIEKAFLMLSVHPKDRDYLRFFYPMQKVFHANGLLSPATLPPKLLLQETWKLELPWDSELPKNIVNKFMKCANEMYLLKEVTVPRYIAINETSELHIFVDASKSSYGACVFVRTVIENDVKVTLLCSKARVAPLKSLTIPRLELMSCCLGARIANSIIRALNLPGIKVIYWSDSEVALWWIREQGNWSVFVANRVKETRELTQFQSWRHVPSNMNMADLLSRGCTPQKMLDSKWWEGPRWLKNNREQWPANEINCEPKDVILEKKKSELVNVNISEELVPCSNSPMSEPVSLPADRVKDANAFDITGIDLAGPLFTRDGELSQVVGYLKWKFNPPTAAWWGGWWERLVRVIKELLKRTLEKNKKYRRKLIHDFRSRFRKEYLGQLRQKRPGKPGHDVKVGDVVMIEEPSKKRVYWPLGKVISLLPGRDGKVRT